MTTPAPFDPAAKPVCLITGGSGGMGLATARIVARDHHVVLADVREDRLDAARDELETGGADIETVVGDVSQRDSVHEMVDRAASAGRLASVIHTAGVSPQMGNAEKIIRINALGTVLLNEAVLARRPEGVCVVNVASMAAHMAPKPLMPVRAYPLAATDKDKFVEKLLQRCNRIPASQRSGMAYSISKHFVVWYSRFIAPRFGELDGRVLSVSPGTFDTEMGRLEEKSGAMRLLQYGSLKRAGRPEEIAEILAFAAGDRAGYLTATDILVDGGVVAGLGWRDMLKIGR